MPHPDCLGSLSGTQGDSLPSMDEQNCTTFAAPQHDTVCEHHHNYCVASVMQLCAASSRKCRQLMKAASAGGACLERHKRDAPEQTKPLICLPRLWVSVQDSHPKMRHRAEDLRNSRT